MKEFICLSCGMKWYSAASIDEPCANCGGLLQETGLQQYNEPRRFELVVNRPKHRHVAEGKKSWEPLI